MRTLLRIVLVLIGLVVIGLAVFLFTFNADRYRPLVESRLEETLGNPVSIGRLSLAWSGGLALEVRNLAVFEDASRAKPSLTLERARFTPKLLPLLRKSIEVGSITLVSPKLEITKDASGVTLGSAPSKETPAAPAASSATRSRPKKAASPPSFYVGTLKISAGDVRFVDRTQNPPLDIRVRAIDVDVKNVSLTQPAVFQAKAGLFSRTQNVQASGTFVPPLAGKPAVLENFRLKLDVARMNPNELALAVPALASAGVSEGLSGVLTVDAPRLILGPLPAGEKWSATATLENGRVPLKKLRMSLDALQVEAAAEGDTITLKKFSAQLAGGKIEASGTIGSLRTVPALALRGEADGLSLDSLLPPPASPGAPIMKGKLSAALDVKAAGSAWDEISHSITGKGRITLSDGVILNLNVVKSVLDQLAAVPFIGEKLALSLPPDYEQKLSRPDTVFRPVDAPVEITNGVIYFNNAGLISDSFALFVKGGAGLDGNVSAQGLFLLDSQLSAAIVQKASEFTALVNAQGQIAIPVLIKGGGGHVQVYPDTNYLGKVLAAGAGQDILTQLLTKGKSDQTNGGSQPQGYEKLLTKLFK